jgi:hypothetical protein
MRVVIPLIARWDSFDAADLYEAKSQVSDRGFSPPSMMRFAESLRGPECTARLRRCRLAETSGFER